MKVSENRLKIIIDIPEELYRYITGETYDEHLDRRFDFTIRHAVRNGSTLDGKQMISIAVVQESADKLRRTPNDTFQSLRIYDTGWNDAISAMLTRINAKGR